MICRWGVEGAGGVDDRGALRKEHVERALLCGLLGCPQGVNRQWIDLRCLRGVQNLEKAIAMGGMRGGFGLPETVGFEGGAHGE